MACRIFRRSLRYAASATGATRLGLCLDLIPLAGQEMMISRLLDGGIPSGIIRSSVPLTVSLFYGERNRIAALPFDL